MLTSSLLLAPAAQTEASAIAPAAVSKAGVNPASTDWGALLTLHPAGFAGAGVQAMFSKAAIKTKRPVQLQRWNGVKWTVVSSAKMAASGLVEFRTTPIPTDTYRAVALKYKSKKKPVGTPHATNTYAAPTVFDFNGPAFNDPGTNGGWENWLNAGYDGYLRYCSAPLATNATVADGKATLSVTKGTDAEVAAARANGKCSSDFLDRGAVYGNSQVSTRRTETNAGFSVKSGIVQAQIKFPSARGMHAGVWLESIGPELDMIETYGAGKRATNVVHLSANDGGLTKSGNEEYKWYSENQSWSWYQQWHVVSLEWTTTQMVFRIDGEVTAAKKITTPPVDYFLVMTNLSSDWELNSIEDAQLPASMAVDFVQVWPNS